MLDFSVLFKAPLASGLAIILGFGLAWVISKGRIDSLQERINSTEEKIADREREIVELESEVN